MERKIGEIFEYNGEWYQCIESPFCGECSLFTTECESGTKSNLADKVFGQCSKVRRFDKKQAIFKKLKKVKEIDGDNGTFQTYKLDAPLCGDIPEEVTGFTNVEVVINVKNKDEMKESKVKLSQEEYDYIKNKIKMVILPGNLADDVNSDELGSEVMKLFSVDAKLFNSENLGKNLKPFNLEKAKSGKPVCTRDGRKARIICFDAKDTEGDLTIVALIEIREGYESIERYNMQGKYLIKGCNNYDLMMLPEKKEGWVNIYRTQIYTTLEKAKKAYRIAGDDNYIETIKVEWEE